MHFAIALASTLVCADPAAAPAKAETSSRIPLVVLDLRADGVDASLGASITGLVASELHDSGVLQPTTEEDIRRIMDLEQMKLMLACTAPAGEPAPKTAATPEAQCLSSFKQALGAKLLVTGNVGKAGDDVLVSLTLIDLDKAVSIGRETAQTKSPAGLVSAVRGVLPKLIAPILKEKAGQLSVVSNEEGATVLVDGAAVGTAPWRGEHVPAGPHRISATKEGFIESNVDVVVPPGGSGAIQIILVPSKEFADAQKKTAMIYRISAFSAAGLAALSLAGGTGVFIYESTKTADFAKTAALDNTGAILLPAAKYNEINSLRYTDYALFAAAIPFAGVSAALFYLGDDPSKYDALLPAQQ